MSYAWSKIDFPIDFVLAKFATVEPPNKGHFGDTASVLISEVVPFSEVFLPIKCLYA